MIAVVASVLMIAASLSIVHWMGETVPVDRRFARSVVGAINLVALISLGLILLGRMS